MRRVLAIVQGPEAKKEGVRQEQTKRRGKQTVAETTAANAETAANGCSVDQEQGKNSGKDV